jgi:phytoene dehydrogenase-like protein
MSGSKKGLVVIGGGVTGLSAALAYAVNEDVARHPVLVLEKQPKVGGYVTSFKRQGFLFDTAQIVGDISHLLDYLGVEIELRRFEGYFARIFLADTATSTARVFEIPSGREAFEQKLVDEFPGQADAIHRMFAHSRAMYEELWQLKVEPGFLDIVRMLLFCRKTVANGSKTFAEYLDGFGLTDPRLREIFDVFAAFSGLPCGRVATPVPVVTMNALLEGTFRTRRGFIHLPHRMRRRLEQLGGEVRTNKEVTRIAVEDGRARGVEVDGELIEAENVVTTIDPKVALTRLVGSNAVRALDPAYADKLDRVRMSPSSLNIALGLDDGLDLAGLGMDCGYNVITTGGGTFEELFQAFDRGESGFTDECFHLGAICPSLTTGSKPCLTIRVVPLPLADWTELRERDPDAYRERKERLAASCVEKVERFAVPGLSEHVVVRDVASPATFARYSGSPTGSNYDMSPYPDNYGRTRLETRTPIEGLYQPKFSHGIMPGMISGLQAADMILEGKVLGGYARLRPR